MPNLPRPAVISSQPDPLVPSLAAFLTAHGRPASVLAGYLPSPVLSEVEAAMTALGTDAVLNASRS